MTFHRLPVLADAAETQLLRQVAVLLDPLDARLEPGQVPSRRQAAEQPLVLGEKGQVVPDRLRLPGPHRPDGGPLQIRPELHHGRVLASVGFDDGLGQPLVNLQPLFPTGGLKGAPARPVAATQDAALPGMTLVLGYLVDRHAVDMRRQLLVEVIATVQGGHGFRVARQPGQHHNFDLGKVADTQGQAIGRAQQGAHQAGQHFHRLGEKQR